jgi:hypothetical protein
MAITRRPGPSARDATASTPQSNRAPPQRNQVQPPWNDTARGGLIVKYTPSTEPVRSGSFWGRIFRFGALEKAVPGIIYLVIAVGVALFLIANVRPIMDFLVQNVLSYVIFVVIVLAAFGAIFGNKSGPFDLFGSLLGKAGRKGLGALFSLPRMIASGVHEGVHDAIITPSRSNSNRDVQVHTYRLRRVGPAARDGTGSECTVRMRGFHNGAEPAEGDMAVFEGRLNRRTGVFEAFGGTQITTGEPIVIRLPAWAR